MKNTISAAHPIWTPLVRVLSNPSLVALVLFLITIAGIFYFMGEWLFPVIVSVVLAYLLEGIVVKLQRVGVRRVIAFTLVFFLFCTLIFYILLALVPTILTQAKTLLLALPDYLVLGQQKVLLLPQKFPHLFSQTDVQGLLDTINSEISSYSKLLSGKLFNSLFVLAKALVYLILVPLLVFFFLKDKDSILRWLGRFLPKNKQIIQDIWAEVDVQIGNYIRGKFAEIFVVWIMCFLAFHWFNLQYGLLLSFMVGLSVLIPYIGATLVTIPVLVVAYVQFGDTSPFYWIAGLYFVIQMLDGNVIVPLIFSEAVNIHPVAIIISVLVFGGLWGFWGVFFAIPLATVVKAIIEAWRRYQSRDVEEMIDPA